MLIDAGRRCGDCEALHLARGVTRVMSGDEAQYDAKKGSLRQMADQKNNSSVHLSGSDDPSIVEPAQDPAAVHLQQQQQMADGDADFARTEARFAVQEQKHVLQLRREGRWQEAESYARDARERMHDADMTMQVALEEDEEAEHLREDREKRLAVELQQMPNQSIATLRTAVADVRLFVQDMDPSDKLKVGLASGMNEDRIEAIRERAIVAGYAIEQALGIDAAVRSNPRQIIADLVTFTAAVMTLADHLPALMELVTRFGQLLSQFHLG